MSISKIKDSAGVAHDINATTINNLHLLDQSYAYAGSISISIGCVNAVVITGKTESEIFALTGNLYGKLYLASDTGKYWRRKDTQTTAGQTHFRDDTTACTASLALPDQLTTEDAIYVRINLNQKYYSQLPKFFVTASYDNISGSTSITGFCRQQNQFEITSCAYNGNNLVGIYQPTANTDIYIFKFTKFRSSYGAISQCNVTPVIYYNFYSGTPTIDFISKDDSDYDTVKNYAYISVPSFGIVGTNIYGTMSPISSGSYDLGRSGDRWRNLYLSGVVSNGTYTYTLPSKNGTIALTSDIDDTNTWRKVQLDGVDKLGNANSTNPLNLKAGDNVEITESNGTFTFNANYQEATTTTSGLMSSTDKKVVNDVKALMEGQSDQLVDDLSDVLEVLENWNEGTTLASELNKKVDKVDGKGLSTNDYTTTEKNKLAGIATGAEVNVQADWTVTDTSSDAYIKNKPSIPENVSDLVNDAGYTTNTGTITGITMNGASKGTSGVVDLGTVLTEHQDISGKLDKTTFEWNKQLANGSNGKVCLGKFFMYDSNVTINMTLTTSVTYNATVVIRSQNLNREGSAGGINVDVYSDPKNTITPLLTIFRPDPNTASGSVEVYANLGGWSKCLVHVQGVGLETKTEGGTSHTGAYDILTNVSDIPTEVENKTLVTPRNMLTTTFQPLGSYLTTTGTAVNSAKLNNQDSSYYLNYNNFTNTPTIPTKTSELTNDSNFISEETQPDWNQTDTTADDYIKNKPVYVFYAKDNTALFIPPFYEIYVDSNYNTRLTGNLLLQITTPCIILIKIGTRYNFISIIDNITLYSRISGFIVQDYQLDNNNKSYVNIDGKTYFRPFNLRGAYINILNSGSLSLTDDDYSDGSTTVYSRKLYGTLIDMPIKQSFDSLKLNNQDPSYYLDYNNLTNKPTIPTGVDNITIDLNENDLANFTLPLEGGTQSLSFGELVFSYEEYAEDIRDEDYYDGTNVVSMTCSDVEDNGGGLLILLFADDRHCVRQGLNVIFDDIDEQSGPCSYLLSDQGYYIIVYVSLSTYQLWDTEIAEEMGYLNTYFAEDCTEEEAEECVTYDYKIKITYDSEEQVWNFQQLE